MTINPNGKNYICLNFGNTGLCCIDSGLGWYYTIGTTNYPESGGTSQIVARLASGLVDSLTMTNPARGTFTQVMLNNANGGTVTLQDAQAIHSGGHDTSGPNQWCFSCEVWTDHTLCTQSGCFWYNGSCHSTKVCSAINNSADCAANNCHWYNGSCHDTLPANCSVLNNQSDCALYGCIWYNGACYSEATVPCTYWTTQTPCEQHGCHYWNQTCQSNLPGNGEAINNQPDCARYGYFWYNIHGVWGCHSADQPQICYWVDAKGGPTGLDITEVFQMIDSYVLGTPPSGYTFVPTVQQVMGVIDYFLGFYESGDLGTGCDYIGP